MLFKIINFFVLFLVITFSLITKDEKVVESKGYIIAPVVGAGNVSPATLRPDNFDIRIADRNGQNPVPFWRETNVRLGENGNIILWFKAKLGYRISEYYLYYNNPDMNVDHSNPYATFLFYDDFSNENNFRNNWAILTMNNRPTISGGALLIYTDAGNGVPYNCIMRCMYEFNPSVSMVEYSLHDASQVHAVRVGWRGLVNVNPHHFYGLMYIGENDHHADLSLETHYATNVSLPQGSYHPYRWYRFQVFNQHPYVYTYDITNYNNRRQILRLTEDKLRLTAGNVAIWVWSNPMRGNRHLYIDDIRIRRRFEPEPTIVLLKEETGNWNGFRKRRQMELISNTHSYLVFTDYTYRLLLQVKTCNTTIGDM